MFSPSLGFKNLSKVDFKDWNWGLLAGSICRPVPFIPATCCRILSCALVIMYLEILHITFGIYILAVPRKWFG